MTRERKKGKNRITYLPGAWEKSTSNRTVFRHSTGGASSSCKRTEALASRISGLRFLYKHVWDPVLFWADRPQTSVTKTLYSLDCWVIENQIINGVTTVFLFRHSLESKTGYELAVSLYYTFIHRPAPLRSWLMTYETPAAPLSSLARNVISSRDCSCAGHDRFITWFDWYFFFF